MIYYKKAIELNSKNDMAYNNLGLLYSTRNEYQKAMKNFEKAIELNHNNKLVYANIGNIYKIEKKYDKAIKFYKKAIDINPIVETYFSLGFIYDKRKEYDKAIYYYQKAIDINPKFDACYNNIGYIFYTKKEYSKAINFYRKSIKVNPNSQDNPSYSNIKIILNTKQEYSQAINQYKNKINFYQKYEKENNDLYISKIEKVYTALATLYYDLKQYKNALYGVKNSLILCLKLRQNYPNKNQLIKEKYNYLSSIYSKMNLHDKSKKYSLKSKILYNKILINRLNKKHRNKNFKQYKSVLYNTYFTLGNLYFNQAKLYNQAIVAYKKALSLQKENNDSELTAYIHFAIAKTYEKLKKGKKAEIEYKKSIELYDDIQKRNLNVSQEKIAHVYFNLGNLYFNLKQDKNAIKKYQQSLPYYKKIKNNSNKIQWISNVYSNSAITYKRLEIYDKAIKLYIKSFKINLNKSSLSYTNLFELQLIQNQEFDQKLESKYIELFKYRKENFIYYEMLKKIQSIINNEPYDIENWKEKYRNIKLNWNFNILDEWINNFEDKQIKAKLEEVLKVFEEHDKKITKN
jgi:tetratricopeptide (TPR) repeat protein